MEPGALRRAVADTFMLTVDAHRGHPFQLAGTRVCAPFGQELKNQSFIGLWRPECRDLMCTILTVVIRESLGVVASANATTSEGAALEFEFVLLPLKQRGRTDGSLIGALAPRSAPDWLGLQAVGPLMLGPHRYLGHHSVASTMPCFAPELPVRDQTHGLVVYQGGRS